MGGGLMQLVAYGAQDVYLTGSPQITFFKLIYRRHTNFALESIEQTFNGDPGFGKKASVTISRNGDLVTGMFLQVTFPEAGTVTGVQLSTGDGEDLPIQHSDSTHSYQYVNSVMHRFLESCEIEIGGQRIDKHYNQFYEACDELRTPEEKRVGYGHMVGKLYDADGLPQDKLATEGPGGNKQLSSVYQNLDSHMGSHGKGGITYYMPLRFWFNENPGLALPLIALQYHEVKLHMSFAPMHKLVKNNLIDPSTGGPMTGLLDGSPAFYEFGAKTTEDPRVSLWVDYVYLDTDERRRFAQVSHEYLIEQLQFTGHESIRLNKNSVTTKKVRLNFNHPTKELVWFVNRVGDEFNFGEGVEKVRDGVDSYTNTDQLIQGHEYVRDAMLMLNGHERFGSRPGSYFRLVVPFQCHTRIPSRHIYCYSFSLRPEEHNPSGTLNFSRIDNASLHLTLNPSSQYKDPTPGNGTVTRHWVGPSDAAFSTNKLEEDVTLSIYAISYNILRIVSGMGGLAYSN